MDERLLGATGLTVSALGFGAGSIGGLMVRGEAAEQHRTFFRAIEAGITYVDTAPGYGSGKSEEALGPLLREAGAEVYVGTKVALTPADLADPPAAIRRSIEASLRRLGREQVDLFQLHNHVAYVGGPPTDARGAQPGAERVGLDDVFGPIAEGLAAVREAGLTRFVGLTGLGEPAALGEVVGTGRFDTIQCYVNALNPSGGWPVRNPAEQDFGQLIGRASEAGMGVIAIRVLAAGALAATDERHPNAGDPGAPLVSGAVYDANLERARALRNLASELGLESPAELSFRLVLSNPGVSTALVGFSDASQLETALRWAERGPLPAEAVERIMAGVKRET